MPSVAQRQQPRHANIFLAASDNDLSAVSAFLDSGVPVNDLDGNGYSTLHAASSYNHLDLAKYLIQQRGGNPNLEDHEGDTPLFVAETRDMAALLIELGADVGHVNREGKTALAHMIEEDEFPDIVAYLSAYPGASAGPTTSGVATTAAVTSGLERQPVMGATTPDSFRDLHVRYEERFEGAGESAQDMRIGQQQGTGEQDGGGDDMLGALPQETKDRIQRILDDSARDGIDRDEELRAILSEALVGGGVLNKIDGSTRQRIQ